MAVESIHQRLERERKAASPEAANLVDFRNYARGHQRGTLTAAQQRILRGVVGRRFCDNVCKMVLQAVTARVQIARFEVSDKTVEDWLRNFWTLVSLPVLANQTHWAALRDGNHAVALTWDKRAGQVRLVRERWWDGKTGIFIAYDDEDKPTYAVKEWKSEAGMRRVIWYPDHIERYIASGSGWKGYMLDPEEPGSWKADWVDRSNEPLGLPVVHFRNIYMPNDSSADDSDALYGVSELDGGVLGLQDEINDVHRDITSAARYTGYQMLYATGVTLERDASDKPVPLKIEPGAVFSSENAAARYGTLPAGELDQLDKALNIKLRAVSRITATPLHEITGGDWPSGEALLQADQPLIKKSEAIISIFGPAWGSTAHKATMLANAFGSDTLDTEAMITSVFMSPDRRDPLTQGKIADAIAKHVSKRETLRVLGKGPADQKKVLDELISEVMNTPMTAMERAELMVLYRDGLGISPEWLLENVGNFTTEQIAEMDIEEPPEPVDANALAGPGDDTN